jgi:hypothetical protein
MLSILQSLANVVRRKTQEYFEKEEIAMEIATTTDLAKLLNGKEQ